MKVCKKNGNMEEFNPQKIVNACEKSAQRVLYTLTKEDYDLILKKVKKEIDEDVVDVAVLHSIVENVLLNTFPTVGKQYQQYRNYKLDFAKMLDGVYQKSQEVRYIGDVSNANTDSTMVSTQRSLIYGELNKELYKKFFLNSEERQACKEGYIYIHDMKDRLDSINCLLFDLGTVLTDGFEMGNIWYNEPKTLDVAFDVISDLILSASAQSYGGFTTPRIDRILSKYAKKSYELYKDEYMNITRDIEETNRCKEYAFNKVRKDMENGVQGLEYKLNTVSSSRGDFPFTTVSFGLETDSFGKMVSESFLKVRMGGQGRKDNKKPVLFPKLTFLYDKNIHGKNKKMEDLFNLAIECSSKSMYPDFLSLTADEGYIPSIYKEYGEAISLMG